MISTSWPRPFTVALTIASIFASTVISQDPLVPSSGSDIFPACAANCPILKEAQSSCQASPDNDRATVVACFCESSLLTTLHSNPQGICDDTCTSPGDLKKLQSWYSSFCESGGNPPGNGQPTGPTTTSSAGSSPTGGSQGSGGSTGPTQSGPGHQNWIDGHWQWVVMVVVLVIGFTALAVGGVCLRRRYHRKHDPINTGSSVLPPPANRSSSAMQQQSEAWGPQQQTVHPRGADFVDGNPSNSETYLPHMSETSTPDVSRMTPTSGNSRLARGRR